MSTGTPWSAPPTGWRQRWACTARTDDNTVSSFVSDFISSFFWQWVGHNVPYLLA
jgi:hypothetical protein